MANTSIKAAFERMWQHVVSALALKADKTDIVQSDWSQTDETADDYIKNKPDLDVVKFTEQTLTEEEKAQARENIGALTVAQIEALNSMFMAAAYTEDVTSVYEAFKQAFGIKDEIVDWYVEGLTYLKNSNWTSLTIPNSELSANTGLMGVPPNWCGSGNTGRQTFVKFIPIEAGATYRFDFEANPATTQVCIEAYNTIVMNRVKEGTSGFVESDRYSSGWNASQTTGCSFTIPETMYGSPMVAMRFTFNAGSAVTSDVTITKVVV
jgi:hypothetical protein